MKPFISFRRLRPYRLFLSVAGLTLGLALAALFYILLKSSLDEPVPGQIPATPHAPVQVTNIDTTAKGSSIQSAIPQEKNENEVNWCGYGRVSVSQKQLPPQLAAAAKTGLAQTLQQLQAATSEQDRMLGFYAAAVFAGIEAHDNFLTTHPNCENGGDCRREMLETSSRAVLANMAPLLRIAENSRDPSIYAAAYHTCESYDTRKHFPACMTMTPARWAQLDPGNAAPWMFAASDAALSHDEAQRNEALFQISQARSADLRMPFLPGIINSTAAETQAPATQVAMLVNLVGVHAAQAMPVYFRSLKPCLQGNENDSNLRQLCSDVANKLSKYDQTLVGNAMAIRIATLAGWDQARITELKERQQSLWQLSIANNRRYPTYSCDWLQAQHQHIRDEAQYGEMDSLTRQSATPDLKSNAKSMVP